jgi:hypothetical protein
VRLQRKHSMVGAGFLAAVLTAFAAAPASAANLELLADGGFEQALNLDSPAWAEADTVSGSPICEDSASFPQCVVIPMQARPSAVGGKWVWFGGANGQHTASVSQNVQIPAGSSPRLSFRLFIGAHSAETDANLSVTIGGSPVMTINEAVTTYDGGYGLVGPLDVSQFADGVTRPLKFEYTNPAGGFPNINLDDVSLFLLDTDNDGVLDGADNCNAVANATQADNDGDGAGDPCDGDDDNDGVDDGADNCTTVANPNQTNSDTDPQGNACDLDDDNDGFGDGVDNCPTDSNPAQNDTDGDGRGNACDPDDGTLGGDGGGSGNKCTVPKVKRGAKLGAAKKALKSAGCAVGKISRKPSSRVPKGKVVRLKKKAGTVLPAGTAVAIVVSKG